MSHYIMIYYIYILFYIQIYKTEPWKYTNDSTQHEVYYTTPKKMNSNTFFAILLEWPTDDLIGKFQIISYNYIIMSFC